MPFSEEKYSLCDIESISMVNKLGTECDPRLITTVIFTDGISLILVTTKRNDVYFYNPHTQTKLLTRSAEEKAQLKIQQIPLSQRMIMAKIYQMYPRVEDNVLDDLEYYCNEELTGFSYRIVI